MAETSERYQKNFPGSWDQLHRDDRALDWRRADLGPRTSVVAITRGGLVPAAIVARELEIRMIDPVCVSSYEHQSLGSVEIIKPAPGDGEAVILIDDLVDTGKTARVVREMMPKAGFATVYANAEGRPLASSYVTDVSQDTWIFFPWDTEPSFIEPIANNRT